MAHAVHDDGGQERALAELVRRIYDDYEIVIFASELADDLRELVTWKRVPTVKKPAPVRFALFYVVAGVRLRAARLDLLHSLGAVVPQRCDFVTVQCCHTAYWHATRRARDGTPPLRRLNTAIARQLSVLAERWSFRPPRARLLAAVSSGAASDLAHHYPTTPIQVIPNAVDSSRFHPDSSVRHEMRSALGVDEDTLVSLFVGGDWYRKGLPVAIEALAHAERELASSAGELWVVGGGDERGLADFARSLGVAERIRFLGFRQDTERYYQAADVFLLPTQYESFSLALLEAAASGLPLIVPPVNGVAELVDGDDGGLVVAPEPHSTAAALVRLARDPELRSQLGGTARRRAAEFTWGRVADEVVQAYDALLEEAR